MFPTYPDLKERTALVTGASSGIGRGIAEELLAQGARVAAQHRTQQPPRNTAPVQADLGSEAGCAAAARSARQQLGSVEVLVHSAGIYNAGPIASLKAETLEEMFRVNVFSAFYLVRELLPAGLRNVVFIGSTAGQRGEPGHSHYAASKGAVQSMMMSLAVELAPRVRVNLVSPGWVRTPMAEESLKRIGPLLVPTLPNKRVAEVDDVVNAALWLASDASSHCIGQDLCISGGALLVVPRGQVRPV
ncbi:MAG TPA: SDR family oxidoreductase [Myxococcales bacterium]|jgi:3-oxoacyl-[acyl-carrier protein] reductase|nr:SDR family oxidoreductase [Myxococcales bacterium]